MAGKFPYRCWFTKEAVVYGLACETGKKQDGWAKAMSRYMRKTATVMGTLRKPIGWKDGSVSVGEKRTRHKTLQSLLNDKGGWKSFKGRL